MLHASWKSVVVALLLAVSLPGWAAVSFGSAHALVVDEDSGEVLFEKNADVAAPIASMTKLMTAMVVLDADLPDDEMIRIEPDDLDTLKNTTRGVPVGSQISRGDLLQLALVASDNHAAAALARTFPGGHAGFRAAVSAKIRALGLEATGIEEPTGLSPRNHASAHDMARILKAAAAYPVIAESTSKAHQVVTVDGRLHVFRNTNRLVGRPGWDILASKTGFTREAGRCVTMRLQAAGRRVLVVLMGAMASSHRTLDALNIHRWLDNPGAPRLVEAKVPVRQVASVRKKASLKKVAARRRHR